MRFVDCFAVSIISAVVVAIIALVLGPRSPTRWQPLEWALAVVVSSCIITLVGWLGSYQITAYDPGASFGFDFKSTARTPWLLGTSVLLLAVSTAIGVVAARQRKARQPEPRERRCRHCGYDLRATPSRCPECGGDGD